MSKKGSVYFKSDLDANNDNVNDTFDNISNLNLNKSKVSMRSYNMQGDEPSLSLKDNNTSHSSSRVISGSGRELRMIDCRVNQSKYNNITEKITESNENEDFNDHHCNIEREIDAEVHGDTMSKMGDGRYITS